MPGFSPQPVTNNIRNGNSVAAMVGDQIVWFAQTVGHQYPFGAEQLYGIGSALPQEVQQLRVAPQITLTAFDLTSVGTTGLQGGTNLMYILAGNAFDLHVYDGLTDSVVFTYVAAKCQSPSQNIPANAPVTDTYAFLAMDVLDADGNSILNTGENAINIATAAASAGVAAGALGLTA